MQNNSNSKNQRKKYSVNERVEYHKKRINSFDSSIRAKSYSMSWLEGYNDSYAKQNYSAVCSEITARKKNGRLTRNESAVLYGFKNGLKARLSKK